MKLIFENLSNKNQILQDRSFGYCNDDDEVAKEREDAKMYVNNNDNNLVHVQDVLSQTGKVTQAGKARVQWYC